MDFTKGIGIYILPSNLNLSIGKTGGCNNKIVINCTEVKIGSNKNLNKDEAYRHKSRSLVTTSEAHSVKSLGDKSIKDYTVTRHECSKTMLTKNNRKMLTK